MSIGLRRPCGDGKLQWKNANLFCLAANISSSITCWLAATRTNACLEMARGHNAENRYENGYFVGICHT